MLSSLSFCRETHPMADDDENDDLDVLEFAIFNLCCKENTEKIFKQNIKQCKRILTHYTVCCL